MSKKNKIKKSEIKYSPPIIIKKPTSEYLNNEVKDFSLYVVQTRALPNIMDGLKIGSRKIIEAAINGKIRKGQKEKLPVLLGNTMELEFHHGDASLKKSIEQLGAKHSFELAPLDVIGQVPSLRVPKCDTAARYLSVRTNKNIELFKTDLDILEYNIEEGKKVEPKFFLPIIPIVLLWRTNSPGFGFSFRSFSHNVSDVIEACISSIINGTCNEMHYVPIRPHIEGIKPSNIVYNNSKESWYNVGEYELDFNNDLVTLRNMPYNVSYNSLKKHLDMLKEKLIIVDWAEKRDINSKELYVVVKFNKGGLARNYDDKWKFYTRLKLVTKIPNLTLNTIDIDTKSIVSFGSTQELVDGFVKRRLIFYNQRKTKLVKNITEQINVLKDRINFIQLILDDKLIIKSRNIKDIEKDCDNFGVTYEGLKLPISRLTIDEINKSENLLIELTDKLDYIINTTPEMMYLLDLHELRKTLLSDRKEYILGH